MESSERKNCNTELDIRVFFKFYHLVFWTQVQNKLVFRMLNTYNCPPPPPPHTVKLIS